MCWKIGNPADYQRRVKDILDRECYRERYRRATESAAFGHNRVILKRCPKTPCVPPCFVCAAHNEIAWRIITELADRIEL